MIPIVLGGTPVSRFWVIGGVAAMMNGYPWVVQLKVVTEELLKIMPPEVTRPPGGEEPQPFHGPHCGGTVINSRLVFLNIDIIYVIKKLFLPSVMNVEEVVIIAATSAFIKRILINPFKAVIADFRK